MVVLIAAAVAAPAAARAGAPRPLLPDLMQEAPPTSSFGITSDTSSGRFLLGFASVVANVGEGPFQVVGSGPGGGADMTAHQAIDMSDGSVDSSAVIGSMHYDSDATHNHWHFQPFDDYELRTPGGAPVAPAQKEGFCLVDALRSPPDVPVLGTAAGGPFWTYDPNTFCERGKPDATTIDEGISVGWADEYAPFRAGQDIDVTSVPAGVYYLVQQLNANRTIHELNRANDVASVALSLSWPRGGSHQPVVTVLRSCGGSTSCRVGGSPSIPPSLRLAGPRRFRFGRAIYLYVRCDEACTVTASGRMFVARRARVLRTHVITRKLPPGVRTRIPLRFSGRARRAIARALTRGRRARLRVSVVAADAAGNRRAAVRTLTLLRR